MKKLIFLVILFIYDSSTGSSCENVCTPKHFVNISENSQAPIITLLTNTAQNLLEEAKKYATLKTRCSMPMDCAAVLEENPVAKSGIYTIWPRSRIIQGSVEVYCDMDDDGGAWTVIQRRGDFDSNDLYFFKSWVDYKSGFGDLKKDFWLGNDIIFGLTNQRSNSVKFVLTDWEKNTTYATYDNFWIDDEAHNYTLHVTGFRGTAGDSLTYHDGGAFSTKDRDNDIHSSHCADAYKGAWWYKSCHYSNLNGRYLKEDSDLNKNTGLSWYHLKQKHISLKNTEIKLRPKSFEKKLLDITPH